ncbi:RnfABCDGE type electron transport complex subunit B [Candidatus Fermentibacteria bacterium]|nr:RnfABCDGE type electron transport complex subunit B [Candidatus Fermentibacteria bacterium]
METYLIIAAASMGGLGLLFALGLAIADKKLSVEEDPRVSRAADILPGLNCGGCGYPGCRGYAEAVVAGTAPLDRCNPGGAEAVAGLSAIMGVEAGGFVKRIAVLHCQGGEAESPHRARYSGPATCGAASLVQSGFKACIWGCLGLGDCVRACRFDAIHIGPNGLPVVNPAKCTGCMACVNACPRSLLRMHPVQEQRMIVLCSSRDPGGIARKACQVACIGCGICAKRDPDGAITMQQNLAVVDYAKATASRPETVEKCPTGAIKIVDLTTQLG